MEKGTKGSGFFNTASPSSIHAPHSLTNRASGNTFNSSGNSFPVATHQAEKRHIDNRQISSTFVYLI